MSMCGFNAYQVKNGSCKRGEKLRKTYVPEFRGALCVDTVASHIVTISRRKSVLGWKSLPWTLFPPLAMALGGAAIVSSNANALAMGLIEDKGLGSGFLAFLQIGLSSIGSAAMSLFHSGSALPLPSVVIGLFMVMIAVIFTAQRDFHQEDKKPYLDLRRV